MCTQIKYGVPGEEKGVIEALHPWHYGDSKALGLSSCNLSTELKAHRWVVDAVQML